MQDQQAQCWISQSCIQSWKSQDAQRKAKLKLKDMEDNEKAIDVKDKETKKKFQVLSVVSLCLGVCEC